MTAPALKSGMLWQLDRRQSQAFAETLAAPPMPNAALRHAIERYKALNLAGTP